MPGQHTVILCQCKRRRRVQESCESRGGRPGLPVPNSPYGLCGRKATLKNRAQKLCVGQSGRPGLPVPNNLYSLCGRKATLKNRAQKLCENRGGRPGLPVPNNPYGFCGRKATLTQSNKRRRASNVLHLFSTFFNFMLRASFGLLASPCNNKHQLLLYKRVPGARRKRR